MSSGSVGLNISPIPIWSSCGLQTLHIKALASAAWQHLGLEERELLPLARQHLLPGD